ncbi:MAG: phosphoethanolamine--lipid A transferase [Comamonadaceae bacterium]|nr:MAG: phosphoethanolamine--lipid A transferase [Comamonadaceae bacterium]
MKTSTSTGLQRRLAHPAWLIVAASAWLATVANLPLWLAMRELSLFGQAGGWLFAIAFALIIAASLTGIVSLLAWRWTLKPVLAVLLLASAVGAHFMLAYHVVIDTSMITNALQTDVHEVRDLLSLKLAASLLLLGALPCAALWYWPVEHGRWPRRGLHNLMQAGGALLALVLLVLASFSPLASTMRNHKELRYLVNPLNAVYALGYLATQPLRHGDGALLAQGLDAQALQPAAGRPPLLVLVLGETGRSGNFGINGYARDTTPELAREQVASFHNAWSCGTSTAASVPCMFSGLGRTGFESRSQNTEGLLDVIQHAGMAVLWVDNQSGCKGACDRVPSVSTTALAHPALCPGGECFDGIMLEGLDQRIAALPAERRARGVVLVLHQMGSHGPAYHLRSPAAFKRFGPECADKDLQACSRAALVNAYDNSIAYTDHFLASTIAWLKQQQSAYDPAMVYVADHGESLGENNLYLHGMPYMLAPDVQKHVPWITWTSPGFAQRTSLVTACLHERADRPVSHDNYFHSVLGLLNIQTAVYQRALDVYAPCVLAPTDEVAGQRARPARPLLASLATGDISP